MSSDTSGIHHSVMTKTDGNLKFILMMLAFALLAFLLEGNQRTQDRAIDQIATNTTVLQDLRSADCRSGNDDTTKFNALVDELVTSVQQGKSLPPAEQQDRIIRYTALKAPLQVCPVAK